MSVNQSSPLNPDTFNWPVLTRYDRDHLARVALPLGGIGTGTISLGGRGDLRAWEVVSRPAKEFVPRRAFFALYARPEGGDAVTRCLEGPLDAALYEYGTGSNVPGAGLPRFQEASYEAAYPFGQVLLQDPAVPVVVRVQGFNPLVPGDPDRSGIPTAILRYVLTNTTDMPLNVSVCGSLENFIGCDGVVSAPARNVNEFREEAGLTGLLMRSEDVDPGSEQGGTLALATTATQGVSHRTAWPSFEGQTWGDALLDFWDDFSEDGCLNETTLGDDNCADMPVGALAVSVTLAPGETNAITFLVAWRFPNRMTWTPLAEADLNRVGNFYATRYSDAWDVAQRTAADLPSLEADTLSFVRAFVGCDLPDAVKETALYNLSTLRTQTSFRTEDGRFFAWEGCGENSGLCHGTCTYVWNYEQATAFLFPSLARSMRDVEFLYEIDERGMMAFRADLPLNPPDGHRFGAADGQMGCLMKLYRDWQLSGDDEWLRRLWPQAKKTLEFCWIQGGWDADKDGVIEGCQHNTMDVEYYGPNPQMQGWYLGALRACEEMARYIGENDFAAECRRLFEHGRTWTDAHLFNGEYYEHEIRPIPNAADIAPGLRHDMGSPNLAEPDFQLGAGCLIDQLVGPYMADICGLGELLDPAHIKATLHSLMRYNFQPSLGGHFNHLRSFALGDEAAMLMASYPKGRRPKRPFPYYNEVMTGFE